MTGKCPVAVKVAAACAAALLIIVAIIMLGMATRAKPPEVRIMSDTEGKPIEYVVLLNQWNRAAYDRPHYSQVLSEKIESGTVQSCDASERITFDFGRRKPDKINLIVDYNTNLLSAYRVAPEPIKIARNDLGFTHPQRPIGDSLDSDLRYYVLTCSWGKNEAEYAFVVDVSGKGFNQK